MAIINSYPKDINIQDKDAWIGTDSLNRQTKQYTAEAVANYLNVKGKVSIAGQVNYKFISIPTNGAGTMAFTAGGGDGTLFSAITEFKISRVDLSGQVVIAYLNFLLNEEILIMSQTDKEAFGHYRITSYTVDSVNSSFYTLGLTFIAGNGNISVNDHYDIVNFTFGKDTDKNYVFSQAVAAATWTVNHNLNKFPSCTMVLSTGQQGFGDVTFIDKNNLTITFAGATSGKAYIN
jgi:hypothetical protein